MRALKHMVIGFVLSTRRTVRRVSLVAAMHDFSAGKQEVGELDCKVDESWIRPSDSCKCVPINSDGFVPQVTFVEVLLEQPVMSEVTNVVLMSPSDVSTIDAEETLT